MENNSRKFITIMAVMFILLVGLFFVCLGWGSADITLKEIFVSLLNPGDVHLGRIVVSIR